MPIKVKIRGGLADAGELRRIAGKVDGARGLTNHRSAMVVRQGQASNRRTSFSLPPYLVYRCELRDAVGSLGTPTAKPAATYGITFNGVDLPGSYPVDNRTMDVGVVTAATEGLFYYDADGVPHIYSCNEVEVSDPCTPPTDE